MNDNIVRVILESPSEERLEESVIYARRALKDSLDRGEAPFSSYLLYAQENDFLKEIGNKSMLNQVWTPVSIKTVVYMDYGLSDSMKENLKKAHKAGIPYEERYIGRNPEGVKNKEHSLKSKEVALSATSFVKNSEKDVDPIDLLNYLASEYEDLMLVRDGLAVSFELGMLDQDELGYLYVPK